MYRAVFRILSEFCLLLAFGMALMVLFANAAYEPRVAQAFAFSSLALAIVSAAGLLMPRDQARRTPTRAGLLLMLGVWVIGPAAAAAPVALSSSMIPFDVAYFEMASSLTTTGASALRDIDSVSRSVILWRSVCAWIGGFFTIVAAISVFEPLGIGGFEVNALGRRKGQGGRTAGLLAAETDAASGLEGRLLAATRLFAPVYGLATFVCALALVGTGAKPFDAVCYALGALSTTGFDTTKAGLVGVGDFGVELVLLVGCVFAAVGARTHLMAIRGRFDAYRDDPELKYMAIFAGGMALVLFARHWIGALEADAPTEFEGGLRAAWGILFTAVSFTTTTGLESAFWGDARAWSGLAAPGIALLGLAMIGGGVASTAGGIKLMRAALLAKHSGAELKRIAHPSGVFPVNRGGRTVPMRALSVVWMFVMLYVLALALFSLALAAAGLSFGEASPAAIAAIANVGSAYMLADPATPYSEMTPVARFVLCAAMVVGRMEILAMIVILNPLKSHA